MQPASKDDEESVKYWPFEGNGRNKSRKHPVVVSAPAHIQTNTHTHTDEYTNTHTEEHTNTSTPPTKQHTTHPHTHTQVKAATGEIVTSEELGGADVHCRKSGLTDHLVESDAAAAEIVRSIVAASNFSRVLPNPV